MLSGADTNAKFSIAILLTTPIVVAGVRFLPAFVCLSVYPHDISGTAAARIIKVDTVITFLKPRAHYSIMRSRPPINCDKLQDTEK